LAASGITILGALVAAGFAGLRSARVTPAEGIRDE
jgi:hypothetical protein